MAANAPTITIPAYCALLVKSRLMHAEVVKDQFELYQSRNANLEDLDAFRKHLVKAGFLSEYQSVMLSRGHADGFQLGPYTIQDRIGKGRMAGVFRAAHTTGQTVAIKVLPPSSAKDPMLLSRFQREAKLLIKLDHPNVVRAFQFGEAGGKHFFVMEHLEGETLDDLLTRRGKLPATEAVQLVYQAMRGLEHLHSRSMVHRDLKPANLILTPGVGGSLAENTLKANVKLLDIGLGKSFFDDGPNQDTEMQLTSEGVLLGTPDYMAPEQAKNAATADIRADIYSLGCVLYHCLTGQPPFPDSNLMNQIIRHATEPVRPLSDFIKPVPEGLQALLDKLMAKEPDRRFQTPEQAAQALKAFIKQFPEAPPSPPPSPKFLQWLQQNGADGAAEPAAAGNPPVKKESGGFPRPKPAVAEPSPKPIVEPLPAVPTAVLAKAKETGAVPRPALKPKPDPDKTSPAPVPIYAPLPEIEAFDVELVAVDEPAGRRGMLDFNRRDFAMLGIGAVCALAAAGVGYIASRKLRKDPE